MDLGKKQCIVCGFLNTMESAVCDRCGSALEVIEGLKNKNKSEPIFYAQSDLQIPRKVFLQKNDTVQGSIGVYRVLEKIGTGGFGTVYLVKDPYRELKALKLLHLWEVDRRDFEEIKSRFKREYEAGKIDSPYIVQSHEIGNIQGNPFIVMDYYEGGDLRMRISHFWEESKITRLAGDVLNGLHDLHKEGVIHRDLKPENILFDKDDNAILSDFGISGFIRRRGTQVDRKGKVKSQWGTAIYMPPEQIDMNKAFYTMGPVTDIFGFGVLMYEVFTSGYLPYGELEEDQKDLKVFYEKVKRGDWIPVTDIRGDVSERWVHILQKCLHPKQEKRYQSPKEILKELGILNQENYQSNRMHYRGSLLLQVKNGDEVGKKYWLNTLLHATNKKLLTVGWLDAENPGVNNIGIVEKFTEYISYQHATLEYIGEQWSIRDGQWRPDEGGEKCWQLSTNGVFVNGREVGKFGCEIFPNDIITIGDTTLKVEIP